MLKKIPHYFFELLFSFIRKKNTKRYIETNRSIFGKSVSKKKKTSIVLVELNNQASAHISYSYISNILAEKHGAQIKGYYPYQSKGVRSKFKLEIKKIMNLYPYNIYKSFNCIDFFEVSPSRDQVRRAKVLADEILKMRMTKSQFEELRMWDVWIGDLIYDSYLMEFKEPTVDLAGKKFINFLQSKLAGFIFWHEFISTHDVKSIILSHCVYVTAFPLRIAVNKSLEVYQVNAHNFYRLNNKNLFGDQEFTRFPEDFKTLPLDMREKGLVLAEERMSRRFSGEVGVDMVYSKKSSFSARSSNRIISESGKLKILIATHCFFDSPHIYGNNIFPDFYEWLEFLGELSNLTDYDWYIKTHPDYRKGTKEIIDSFVSRYPKISVLSPNSSHHQIISEGIDFALTVYGTIAFEYAALGVPVINCSSVNPHKAYNFNIHAKSQRHYRELLLNLSDVKLEINKKEVFEYYFMRFIYNTHNIIFNDYDKLLENIGGYQNQFGQDIYVHWLNELSDLKHIKTTELISEFIDSDEYSLITAINLN